MYFDPSRTILAGIPRETLQQYLADAQSRYQQLIMGGQPVTVSYEGKSVTYTVAQSQNLLSWVMLLQRQLGINCGRRALVPIFR